MQSRLTEGAVLAAVLVIAAIYLTATEMIVEFPLGDQLGPKAFPRLLFAGLLVAALLLWLELRRGDAPAPAASAPAVSARTDTATAIMVVAVVAWTIAYFLLFQPVGFVPATFAYIYGLTLYFRRGHALQNGIASALFAILSYVLFAVLLGIGLPAGLLKF